MFGPHWTTLPLPVGLCQGPVRRLGDISTRAPGCSTWRNHCYHSSALPSKVWALWPAVGKAAQLMCGPCASSQPQHGVSGGDSNLGPEPSVPAPAPEPLARWWERWSGRGQAGRVAAVRGRCQSNTHGAPRLPVAGGAVACCSIHEYR